MSNTNIVTVSISNDFLKAGENAKASDLATYAENLAELLASEFGAEVGVRCVSTDKTTVECDDEDLQRRVADRVEWIETSDEWIELL